MPSPFQLLRPCSWSIVAAVCIIYQLGVSAFTTRSFYSTICSKCRCYEPNGSFAVDCSGKGLPNIPKGIPPDTEILNLSYNNITAIESRAFEGLENLTGLDLSYNSITHLKNDSLVGLKVLQYLNLDGNVIPYDSGYADGSLNSLDGLETLHLLTDGCPMVFPDRIVGGLTGLRELAIDIPNDGSFSDAMQNLTNLESLRLMSSCTPFRKLTKEDLSDLHSLPLRRLSLRNARLSHIDPNALLGFNKTLKKLDISCNTIDNVPEIIAGLARVSLETLLADRCVNPLMPLQLTSDTLTALTTMNLSILSIAFNEIVIVDLAHAVASTLEPMNLEYLRLGYNQIGVNVANLSPKFPFFLPFIFKLRVIDISGILNFYDNYAYDSLINCLTEDPLFSDSPKEWEQDKIIYAAPKLPLWLWGLIAILRYKYNVISVPPFLTRVYAKDMGKTFPKLACGNSSSYIAIIKNNLNILDASGTHLYTLACYINQSSFPALDYVNGSRMQIRTFNQDLFANATVPNLERLDLSYNDLGSFFAENSSMPLRDMSQVKHLDLSHNGITELKEGLLDQCTSLTTLNLSGNTIETWNASVSNLKGLESLHLSGVKFDAITRTYLHQFDELNRNWKLTTIYLSNITCNCNFEFIMWLHTTNISFPGMTCSSAGVFSNEVPSIALLLWTCVGIYVLSAVCCIFLFIFIGIHFKWKLKYAFYKLRHYFVRQGSGSGYAPVSDITVYLAYHESEFDKAGIIQRFLTEHMDIQNVVGRHSFQLGASEYNEMAFHIERCHFVVLLASSQALRDPKSEFELHMSLEKGVNHILPILVGDFRSYDELPRIFKKLFLLNNHFVWRYSPSESTSELDEHDELFNYLRICVSNLVSRQMLTGFSHPTRSICCCVQT